MAARTAQEHHTTQACTARRPGARANRHGRLAAAATGLAALGMAVGVALSASTGAMAATHPGHRHSTPAFCQHGGAKLWSSLAACGWPGSSNTGPQLSQCPHHRLAPAGTNMAARLVVSRPHAVISCENITGMLYIEAQDVTVENVSIVSNSGRTGEAANGTADIFIADGASATIDHVNINGDDGVHACVWDQGTSESVNAVNCYGVDDGVWSWADTGYSAETGDHFSVTNSYFHNFTHRTSNGHEDGYQTEGASHGLIEHNSYDLGVHADSDVAIWDGLKSSSDITVTGNLMTGGSFAVYAEDYNPGAGGPSALGGFSVTNIHFINNDFSTYASGCVGEYGVWFTRVAWKPYEGGPTDGWHRSGNKVLETGQSVDAGNPTNGGSLCQ
jgi:hypothetical protein